LESTKPPILLSYGYRGLFPHGVNLPEGEAGHSLPSSAEVKNAGAIPSLPHVFFVLCLIKHKYKFIIYTDPPPQTTLDKYRTLKMLVLLFSFMDSVL
jgi:hypothetical protein